MTDPIADLLTRIRNALAVRRPTVVVPYSKLKHELVNLLVREGWVGAVERIVVDERPHLRVRLKYTPTGEPILRQLRRVSRPGRRVYVRRERIPTVFNNLGTAVLSTSRGILTDREARRQKIGGEILCEVA